MMNAKEAKQMTANYIENEALTLIDKIEKHITQTANLGHDSIVFNFPNGTRADIRARVVAIIKEADYHVAYGTNTMVLNINWKG